MMNQKSKKGFTLIEMLIVLSVVGMLVPTTFSIVFVILRQQVRIYRVVETRKQGDYILTYLKDRLIRTSAMTNLDGTVTHCDEVSDPIYNAGNGTAVEFIDNQNNIYQIYRDTATNNLYYHNGVTPIALNSTEVQVTSFNIQCDRRGEFSSPLMAISYTVQYIDTTPTAQEGTIQLQYQTKIKLRE